MHMVLFFIFLTSGFFELCLLLFFWGYSAGPMNAVPFVTLIGCFILMFAAAPLALFFKRISALVALVGAALAFSWPVAAAFDSSIPDVLILSVLPVITFSAAIWRSWQTRQSLWLATVSTSPLWLWVRIVLLGLPVALFVSLFNSKLVLGLLLVGPPK